jgi:hypothetical protein
MKLASVQHVTTPSGSPDPKLIRPQQAKTESYLQSKEPKIGSWGRLLGTGSHGWKSRGGPKRRRRRSHGRPSAPAAGVSEIFSSSFHFCPSLFELTENIFFVVPIKKLGWAVM